MSPDENLNAHNHHPDYLRPSLPTDFLPPVSRWITFGGVFLFSTVIALLGTVTVTPYRIMVKAPARVRPQGGIQIVQSTAAGKVKNIQVTNNRVVKKDDILIVLDDSELIIQKNQLHSKIAKDNLKLVQTKAQIKAIEQKIIAETNKIDSVVASTEVELSRQQRQYQDRQIITTAEVAEAEAALKLAKEKYYRYQQLADTGAISLLQFQEQEAAWETAIARLNKVKAALNPSQANIEIAQKQIMQTKATGKANLADLRGQKEQLNQQQAEFTNNLYLNQRELAKVAIQLKNTLIPSPVDGTIQKLYIRHRDRVVKTGERLAEIVPQDRSLEIKAWIASEDISKVVVGQKALIKLTACPYPDYGTLSGNVLNVSPDSFEYQNQKSNATESRYEVTIKPQNLFLKSSAKQCTVRAGMEGKAEILTHKETILVFLLRKARLIADI